jgi:hypothetical protein
VGAPTGTEGGDQLTTAPDRAIETSRFVAVHQSDPLAWPLPEAVALFLATGYTPRYDPSLRAEDIGPHPFEKHLEGKS